MKLFSTIFSLTAYSAAAYHIASHNADTAKLERRMEIQFDGGFNGLCDREVMEDVNALVLSTINDIMREGKDEALQFDAITIDSESLSGAISHDGERKLQLKMWDWSSFIAAITLAAKPPKCRSNCNQVSTKPVYDNASWDRHLNEDTAVEQLEVAITGLLPHFGCMDGVTHVYVTLVA